MSRKYDISPEMIEQDLAKISAGASAASVFRTRGVSRPTYMSRVREHGLEAKWADAMATNLRSDGSSKQPPTNSSQKDTAVLDADTTKEETPISKTGKRRIDPPEQRGEDMGKKESKKNEKGLILGLPPVLFWLTVCGVGLAVLYFAFRSKKAAQSSQSNQQQDNPEQVDPYAHLRERYKVR